MPGKNEESSLAKNLDTGYSQPSLNNYFRGFRGMRWDRVTVSTIDLFNHVASALTVDGELISVGYGFNPPFENEVWWCIFDRNGVGYLDDVAR